MNRKRKRIDISNDDLCDIHGEITKFTYTCSIDNFSQRPEKTGESIKFPIYVSGAKDKSEWCLHIYPNGKDEESEGHVSVFLKFLNPDKAKAKLMFSILNYKQEKGNVSDAVSHDFDNERNSTRGCSKFVNRDFLFSKWSGLLVNDRLTILCETEIIELGPEKHDNSETSINITIPESKLSLDYADMFGSPFFTDCSIKAEDTEIKVHKVILCARSSVFSDIFKNTLEKLQTNVIEIEGFSVEVVREMLKYIYKDEVSNIQSMAADVLAIADKFKLDRLKVIASKYLCGDLTIENACERFILSEKFSSQELKEFCQTFIIDNAEHLTTTKEWEELVKNHPFLVESLFLKLLNIPRNSNNSPAEEKS
uniref:Speckle-type POZ protein n=1 Tax=Strongyloides papillosus TaxID=174720 RepID=A0A0N5CBT9_STREA